MSETTKYGTKYGGIGFYGAPTRPIERPHHARGSVGLNSKERRKQRQRNRRKRLRSGG